MQIQHAVATEGPRKRKAADDARADGDSECGNVDFTMFGTEPWDAKTNPIKLDWRRVRQPLAQPQIAQGRENIARTQKDPNLIQDAVLSAVPSALFLLLPVFALMLKLAYAFRPRCTWST